jgi:hypothetical protein
MLALPSDEALKVYLPLWLESYSRSSDRVLPLP